MVRFARFAIVALVALVAFTPFSFGQYRQYAQPFAAPAQCSPGMPCYQQNPSLSVMPRAAVLEGQREAPFVKLPESSVSERRIFTSYYSPASQPTCQANKKPTGCACTLKCAVQNCRNCGSGAKCRPGLIRVR